MDCSGEPFLISLVLFLGALCNLS